ncbi:hypothetical protein EK904_005997 [Melospiza melodia maxima]|nr:hypothetical protein EK904_005997 [Melospiza melodia maxima]
MIESVHPRTVESSRWVRSWCEVLGCCARRRRRKGRRRREVSAPASFLRTLSHSEAGEHLAAMLVIL